MVRNEGDVIEAFVRHHAEIFDELVVVDHRSIDGTGETLEALVREGLPLEVRSESSPVHRQSAVLTALMREAAKARGADWVVPLDADEFLVAPGGGVREALARLPDERPVAVDMRFYVPTPDDPTDEPNVLRRVQHRRELEGGLWRRKLLAPSRWAGNSRYFLSQGSHVLVDGVTREFVRTSLPEGLVLAHFPVRSAQQFARKVLGGWPRHVARPERAPDGAFQWRRAFDDVVAGGELTPRQIQAIAFDYAMREADATPEPVDRDALVFDPVPSQFELRYPLPSGPTPLETLAETAVRLAEDLSDARRDGSGLGRLRARFLRAGGAGRRVVRWTARRR
jgi:glycosyl transferase family 2